MSDSAANDIIQCVAAVFLGIMAALLCLFILGENENERRHEEVLKTIAGKPEGVK
jgi:ammonia channel protein AmtB